MKRWWQCLKVSDSLFGRVHFDSAGAAIRLQSNVAGQSVITAVNTITKVYRKLSGNTNTLILMSWRRGLWKWASWFIITLPLSALLSCVRIEALPSFSDKEIKKYNSKMVQGGQRNQWLELKNLNFKRLKELQLPTFLSNKLRSDIVASMTVYGKKVYRGEWHLLSSCMKHQETYLKYTRTNSWRTNECDMDAAISWSAY